MAAPARSNRPSLPNCFHSLMALRGSMAGTPRGDPRQPAGESRRRRAAGPEGRDRSTTTKGGTIRLERTGRAGKAGRNARQIDQQQNSAEGSERQSRATCKADRRREKLVPRRPGAAQHRAKAHFMPGDGPRRERHAQRARVTRRLSLSRGDQAKSGPSREKSTGRGRLSHRA